MKKIIYNTIYKIWWCLLFSWPVYDYRREQTNNKRVYDNFGIIDTLGYNYSEGKYTYNYSDELGRYSGIKLAFGYCIEILKYDNDIFISFKKFQSHL